LSRNFRQVALQLVIVDATGAQHGGMASVSSAKGQEKVFESRVFVPAVIGEAEGAVERLLEVAGQHGLTLPIGLGLGDIATERRGTG
jgi:hypothetical protein